MISRVRGRIVYIGCDFVEIDVAGKVHKVFVPKFSLPMLKEGIEQEIFTYHYYQLSPSRAVPVLIGFLNPFEREFFEMFITVSGIGPRAAVKAFALPVSEIADAICQADERVLCSLPGIGRQKARQIIAKLQTQAPKFALLRDKGSVKEEKDAMKDILEEAFDVLIQLQYKKAEAKAMLRKIESSGRAFASVEDALDFIYRQG